MTKVLIVDDSALMRRLMGGVLGGAGFQVATARNGVEGVSKLTEFEPDVVTLDVNMPEMDGLTALSLMMEARPTPVVMVSSLTTRGAQATFEALAMGAVDFIAKPSGTISLSIDEVAEELVSKVRAAARARIRRGAAALAGARRAEPAAAERRAAARSVEPRPASPPPTSSIASTVACSAATPGTASAPAAPISVAASRVGGLVLMGVSTGGPRTLEDILPALPADYPWPVLLAQHMPPSFTGPFAERMDRLCALRVREVAAPLPLEPGTIYLARGGADMVVAERLGRLVAEPRPETPGHPWHPAVDVLVASAMKVLPAQRLIGVLLTGMGNDGARSMAELRQRGGRTVAEAEDSAVVFGMPRELIEAGGASVVLPSPKVAQQLREWVQAAAA